MNKVLKLQRFGLMTPTVVEYKGKILATNQLDIDNICHLWRIHFCIYPEEEVDLVMTEKQFSVIQQKTLSSVKSVYELLYERNFIPRVFEPTEEPAEWGMYRNKEIEKLQAENAALCERLEKSVELPFRVGQELYMIDDFTHANVWKGVCSGIEVMQTLIPQQLIFYVYAAFEDPDNRTVIARKFTNETLNEIYITREAAESRLAELKGE